jgi:hypothetical protein
MQRRDAVRGGAILVVLLAGVACAQGSGRSNIPWTLDSGETIGNGANVFRAQVGYPGIWLDFIHGIDPTFDIGARFSFNYSFQGTLGFGCDVAGFGCGSSFYGGGVGLDFQLLLRKTIAEISGRYKLAFTFDPGFMLYFPSEPVFQTTTVAGIMFPIGAQIGFPVAPKVVINVSFELPMYITFSNEFANSLQGGAFFLPIMFGGGVEWLAMPNLDVTFKLALGPTIATGTVGTGGTAGGVAFTLTTMAGVGYRF